MTTPYWQERSQELEAMGFDPEGDDWALPDNDEALSFAAEYKAEQMRLAEDPWGDDEEEA